MENWKQRLLKGYFEQDVAIAAADFLGSVHAHSAKDPDVPAAFDTLKEFEQLRIEPYLLATGRRHPALNKVIMDTAERLRHSRDVLVHGDFSPKNILVGPAGIVVVDCEAAWCGDAAFDIAFLMNHILLKSLLFPSQWNTSHLMFVSIWRTYLSARFTAVSETSVTRFRQNTSELLLLLLLARVDGKSPAEYLSGSQRSWIREFVIRCLHALPMTVEDVGEDWFQALRRLYR